MAAVGGPPVSVVASGGAPFVRTTATNVPIATPVSNGKAPPITLVASGAPPIRLVQDDGTEAP